MFLANESGAVPDDALVQIGVWNGNHSAPPSSTLSAMEAYMLTLPPTQNREEPIRMNAKTGVDTSGFCHHRGAGSSGSGMNSASSASGSFMRPAFQSAAAWASRSFDEDTKFK